MTVYSKSNLASQGGYKLGKIKPESPLRKFLKEKKKLLVVIGLILTILILLGVSFWLVFVRRSFVGDRINLSISGPDKVISGDEVTYTVEYSNQENIAITNINIELRYPEGFIFGSSEPEPAFFTNDKWVLDRLEPGGSGKVLIHGKLVGEVDTDKKCLAYLNYRPENFSSEFTKESQLTTKISFIPLVLTADLSDTFPTEGKLDFKITYKNISEKDIKDIWARVEYPDTFKFDSSSPGPSLDNNIWEIKEIKAGEQGEIKISGTLSGETGQFKNFKIQLGMFDKSTDHFYVQAEAEETVEIIQATIELSQTVNGVTQNLANYGDSLEYMINYKNKGTISLTNIEIVCELDTRLLDVNSLVINNGVYKEGKIKWNSATLSGLTQVDPDQGGIVSFKVNTVKALSVKSKDDKNFIIRLKAVLQAEVKDTGVKITSEGNTVMTKMNSKISLDAEGRYFDYEGNQVGIGPLPPKVGQKTTYRVYWYVSNTSNDIREAKVMGTLAFPAVWTEKTYASIGTLSFDSASRKIIWQIGNISANTGQLTPGLEANFEVSIIPDASWVNKFVPLIDEASLTGIDSFTEANLKTIALPIDTNLKYDPGALGKGKVEN